jgi:hypothetical protein
MHHQFLQPISEGAKALKQLCSGFSGCRNDAAGTGVQPLLSKDTHDGDSGYY